MGLRNQVDADRVKLFSRDRQKTYLRQCDERDGGMNDAQLVAELRRSGDLKNLKPGSFALPSVRLAREPEPELAVSGNLSAGDRVEVIGDPVFGIGEGLRATVIGFSRDERFVRIRVDAAVKTDVYPRDGVRRLA
jgi:hypothetical protein